MFGVAGLGGAVGQFFIQGALSAGETYFEAQIFGEDLSFGQLFFDFLIGGVIGSYGANQAKIDFRRMVDIEESLVKVLKRDFVKNGAKGLKQTFKKKSSKFVNDVVKDMFMDGVYDGTTQVLAELMFGNLGED